MCLFQFLCRVSDNDCSFIISNRPRCSRQSRVWNWRRIVTCLFVFLPRRKLKQVQTCFLPLPPLLALGGALITPTSAPSLIVLYMSLPLIVKAQEILLVFASLATAADPVGQSRRSSFLQFISFRAASCRNCILACFRPLESEAILCNILWIIVFVLKYNPVWRLPQSCPRKTR